MADAVERLVNLALHLASTPGTVTANDIRAHVFGYPPEQDDAAFKRMLERDKDDLRAAGLVIHSDDEGNYRLDQSATYVSPVQLSAEEVATVRAAAGAVLDDPSFPFGEDLRLALAKISAESGSAPASTGCTLADEDPERQGEQVAELASAASRRKRVSFGYTNSLGASAPHEVDPYGLFLRDGRWYLVGRDRSKNEPRTYAVSRIESLAVNPAAPKTPDFELPEQFDVRRFVRLPFQFGAETDEFTATIRIDASVAWRAAALTDGRGELEETGEGLVWRIDARSKSALLRFVLEHGPGLTVTGPIDLVQSLREGLDRVEAAHG